MEWNNDAIFWLIIAFFYLALALATPIISHFLTKKVLSRRKGTMWFDDGIIKTNILQPILDYLKFLMYIDIFVFIIAFLVALYSAGVW